jgi:hypothetical protein
MDRRWVRVAAALAFLAVAAYEAYAWNDGGFFNNAPGWAQAVVLLGSYLLTGFLVGRWWALALALVPILIAIPAGDDYDGLQIWFIYMIDSMFLVPITAAGLAARFVVERRSGSAEPEAR